MKPNPDVAELEKYNLAAKQKECAHAHATQASYGCPECGKWFDYRDMLEIVWRDAINHSIVNWDNLLEGK